ncbi:MAG TPA: DUF2784 domain-containing protein [Segetibacter sp.]
MNSLVLLDVLLTLFHVAIIVVNLFGWIWKKTRKLHFILAMATLASWFILGLWFGLGYCPVTDWQWQVKSKLGERNLPASFIEYYAEKITSYNFSTSFIDIVTLVSFLLAISFSVYFNFFSSNVKKKPKV